MNERIRELAVEAGFYANPDVDKFQKFAELIVAECVELFPERNYYYSGLAVQRYIKTHFGGEE